MLASKISLACRKDIFTKDFNPDIYEEFIKKAEEIEKENPFPTKTSKKQKKERSNSKNKHRKSEKQRKNKRRK